MKISQKKKQLSYKYSLILPGILILVVINFLFFYRRWVFENIPLIGVLIVSIGSTIIVLMVFINQNIKKRILNKQKITKKRFIFHSFLSTIIIIVIIVGTVFNAQYYAMINYRTGPVLVWLTDQDPSTEITIIWKSNKESASIVYFGTESNNLNYTINDDQITEWHHIPLTNLTPATTYYYKVEGLRTNEIFSFTTAPLEEEEFDFLVFSDPRQNHGPHGTIIQPNLPKIMMNKMRNLNIAPSFTICCGDITSEAEDELTWKTWFDDISIHSDLGSHAAVQIAVGNHERHGNCEGSIFSQYYPFEDRPLFYYSYYYSSTHFLFLDPWNSTKCDFDELTQAQFEWAKNELSKSMSMKYKIICLHPPPIYNREIQYGLGPLMELCDQFAVDAVFFGHYHSFEFTLINGTNYILIGIGGNINSYGPNQAFCHVHVSNIEMAINMHWLNGTIQQLAIIPA